MDQKVKYYTGGPGVSEDKYQFVFCYNDFSHCDG